MPELFFIAVGLSMDAFAVSIAKGLSMKKVQIRDAALVGAWFGIFQCLMPLIGAWLGTQFLDKIKIVDHWVAFGILAAVGGNMIREAFQKEKEQQEKEKAEKLHEHNLTQINDTVQEPDQTGADLRVSTMLLLAVATSMDALAVGITFSLLSVRILPASLFIGCVTFGISVGGVYAGRFLGEKAQKGASIAGGVVLIAIGVKILLEHLGVIG